MQTRVVIFMALLVGGGTLAVLGQESASYKLKESVFNVGGHPAGGVALSSASYQIKLDAVGESVLRQDLGSASFRMDAGFVSAYPPPRETRGLRLPTPTQLQWDPEGSVGTYNLYRGLLSTLSGLGYGACLQQNLTTESATDASIPAAANGYFYLVTAENRLAEEGTKGFNSAGGERTGNVCP